MAGGSTTSFSNTPQAKDDIWTFSEDNAQSILILDVMGNDLGGAAKQLYSVDNGDSASTTTKVYAPADLLTRDTSFSTDAAALGQVSGISGTSDTSQYGARIWISSDGKIHYNRADIEAKIQALPAGGKLVDTFTYAIKLANGTLSWATAQVVFTGTNDAAVLSSATENLTETDSVLSTGGKLTITDVDSAATFVAQPGTAGQYGTFTIGTDGTWSYVASSAHNEFVAGQTYTDTFDVVSADGTKTTVTVNLTGTNDAATLSADVATLTEGDTAAAISTTGQLTISDVDSPATFVAQTDTAGQYGKFSIGTDGKWTYVADSAHNEFVDGQTYTETFTVTSADGTSTSVTVNITGTNDAAVLSSATENLTETDSVLSTGGKLTITDVDSAATFVAQPGTAGQYGTFTIGTDGTWSYVASSAHNEFVAGQTYTDTFDVVSADGTKTTVTVNLTGTNDAATLSADVATLTEGDTAAAISTTGQLTISDVDSPATFVAQTDTAGQYGKFSIGTDGKWTYVADSAHNEFVDGQTYTETFTVTSADGTSTSVTVNITGTNDAAVLSSATENLTETDSVLSTGGKLTITDVDSAATFVAQPGTAGQYGTFTIGTDGTWSYVASSAHNEFVAGQTYTDTFDVVSADGTKTTVTVNLTGTNDAATLSADVATLTEGDTAAAISTTGQLTISDVDSPATFVAQTDTAGQYGKFSIGTDGKWTYVADSAHNEFVDGQTYTETFTVTSADGTSTSVTVNITGTNDAAVLSSATENLTETDSVLSTGGKLTITDVDSAATFVAQPGTAGQYGTFTIGTDGTWSYVASSAHNEFVAGQTYTDTFDVVSADGTKTTVTVNLTGTNDAATLSADVATLTEGDTAAAISTTGQLTISDVDSPATFVAQTDTAGQYGKFSIGTDGKWTYVADSAHNEFVDGQTYTETFTVTSADGTSTSVTVNITGTNDAAVLSSATENLTETDSVLSTGGKLTITDVDSAATFVAQPGTAGQYGTFTIGTDGTWSYVASSAHNEFVAGQTYTDTFDVVSADGTKTTVTVNLTGTNDAATLSADVATLTEGDTAAAISTTGQLTISDVDSPATFVAQTDTAGQYGKFSIGTDGKWTYVADSAHNEFVDGQTYTETFTVTSADGTSTSVTVNITGTNDAAVLSSATENLTETDSVLSTGGKLTITDVDSAATFVAQPGTAGQYGTFTIGTDGTWSYVASSAHNEFVAGQTYTDTFDVVSADGTKTTVTVNLTGTNDAATLSADVATLTEGDTAAAISTTGQLTISDVDSPATFVAQTDTAGQYGKFSIGTDGKWTYVADSAHNEFVDGQTYTETFTVTSADGTSTSVTVNITGTNDAAVLSSATENLTETDSVLSTGGKLTITDVDSAATFVAQPGTAGQYGTFTIGTDGTWSYVASSAHNEFVAGQTYTDTFDVVSADGTKTTVTVNLTGTNDAATLSADVATLTEGDTAAAISTTGQLTISDVDSPATFVAQTDTAGQYGKFSIGTDGKWTYVADSAHNEFVDGQTYTETFTVTSADGTSTSVTVNITGTNDAAVLSSATENLTETDSVLSTGGKLTITDVDSAATFVAQPGTAGQYGTFTIGTDGTWSYVASSAHNEFVAGQTYTDTFDVVSADGTKTTVTVNLTGTNDAATLSADVATLTEGDTAAAISTTGQLTISDVDSPATFVAQTDTAGQYGKFSIGTDGKWTYVADSAHNEFVDGQTYTETFTVTSADGTSTSVTVNITGTNDAAVLSSATENLTETDSVLSTGGKLTITDVDSAATFVAQPGTAGQYGTFTIGTDGTWSYVASSAHNEFVAGQTYTDTFDVVSADGTKTTVTVNLTGTNDAATLSADVATLTEGDTAAAISTTGQLTISDVDSPATFVAQTDTAGQYGKFSIGTDGKWTYVADSAHNEFVDGQTYTETFTVTSADGTSTSVTVNITGTNDAAVLSSATENLTETDSVLSTGGKLTITDVDSAATFVAQPGTAGQYGTFTIGTDGTWSYVASSAHNEFVAGQTYTDTFDVVSADGTKTTVTVNLTGTNDAATLSADVATLTEGDTAAAISTTGQLTISDVDSPATFVAQTDTAGQYGKFSIGTDGKWTYVADSAHNEFVDGQTYTETFTVTSADGTSTSVTVNITGTNDAAVLSSATENLTETDSVLSTGGKLTITDVDSAATFVAQPGTAGQYGTFTIGTDGTWSYVASSAHNEFVAGQTYTDTFDVVSADGTKTTVTVNLTGTNDAATLSADVATLTEGDTAAAISTTGQLTISDVDSPATFVAQTDTAGQYGKFSIGTDGKWTYVADSAHNEFVDGQTYTETFTVTSADGTSTSVTVNITGTNDIPVAQNDVQAVSDTMALDAGTTLLTVTASQGVLTNDSGSNDSSRVVSGVKAGTGSGAFSVAGTAVHGTYGDLILNADGSYSYVAKAALDQIPAGSTPSDVFTYQLMVGGQTATATLTINITGANDTPVASSAVLSLSDTSAKDAGTVTATGNILTLLGAQDRDGGTLTATIVGSGSGTYGDLALVNGVYTYTAKAAYDQLTASQIGKDVFSIQVSDGQGGTVTKTVELNIRGADDSPTGMDFVIDPASDNGNQLNGGVTLGRFIPTGDPDGGAVSYSLEGADASKFVVDADGTFRVGASNLLPQTTPYTVTLKSGSFSTTVKVWVAGSGNNTLAGIGSDIDIQYGQNGNDTLVGGNGSDALLGGQNNDRLEGGGGNDQLFGGGNNDTFVFSSPSDGVDRILDFGVAGTDKIEISRTGFNLATTDMQSIFGSSATDQFGSVNERFHFNNTTHTLWYDADGSGSTFQSVAILVSDAKNLVSTDFLII